MERALVTGCNGFVGRALVGRLMAAGYEVWGVDRTEADADFRGKRYLRGDLTDAAFVASAIIMAKTMDTRRMRAPLRFGSD